VTDFDGVCSGDIYVFEPNGEHLLSELLPFICQTDGFFQHAVGTSAGSLSPRTNWDSLAGYEFILPPLDDQRRIAQALGAVERAKLTLSALVGATERVCQSVLFELVDRHSERVTALADVATISVGLAISTSQFYRDQGVPLLRNQNIRPSGLDDRDILFLDPTFAMRHKSKKVKPGDVITTRTGANLGDTCVIPAKYEGAHTFTTLITRCDAKTLLPEYLAAHMNSELGKAEIDRLSTSGGKNNLNVGDLRRYQVPIAPLAEQRRACSLLQSLSALIPAQTTRLDCLRDMGSLIAAELSLAASTSAVGRHV